MVQETKRKENDIKRKIEIVETEGGTYETIICDVHVEIDYDDAYRDYSYGQMDMDINNDCVVDFKDIAEFAADWLLKHPDMP